MAGERKKPARWRHQGQGRRITVAELFRGQEKLAYVVACAGGMWLWRLTGALAAAGRSGRERGMDAAKHAALNAVREVEAQP